MKSNLTKAYVLRWIKRYWFLTALFAICLATVADHSSALAALGHWLKIHHGPSSVVVCIFLFSGFTLSPQQLKDGLMDVEGMLLALAIIFVAAPLVAALFSRIPMDTGTVIGLFLVAVMPSTLSSGVVMTAAAGGNAAHALVTTIVSNSLSVFTIPYVLSFLLRVVGQSATVSIDKAAIMLKIVFLVVLPLVVGMFSRHFLSTLCDRHDRKLSLANQFLILFIVWIAMSQTRGIMVGSGLKVVWVVVMVIMFHGLLLLSGWCLIRISGRKKGKRESVLFVGGQKTLPLSIILLMSLFSQYDIALLVCVFHHIVHLMMDAYLVERLKTE